MSNNENEEVKWIPLESNPNVINEYIGKLGVTGNFEFSDLWGLDDEVLQFIPQPCIAVLLLFPITDNEEKYSKEQQEKIKKEGQVVPKDMYFSKQTIPNACGTMAIIHAILNNTDNMNLGNGVFRKIYDDTKNISPIEKAKYLEKSKDLANLHEEFSIQGQTSYETDENDVDCHYTCLVEKDGCVYELDGRKEFPINHGKCNNLLEGSIKIIKSFIERNPSNNDFTAMVLIPKN